MFALAYGETVHQIAGVNDVSVEVLTKAGTFKSMTLLKVRDIIKEVETELQNLPLPYLPLLSTIEYHLKPPM